MASITVIGTGFTGATQCFFGSTGVTIALNSAGTSFTCIPPAGAGTVNIGITSFGGTVTGTGPKGYTYMNMPTLVSLGTTSGQTMGGIYITIAGTNFYDRSSFAFPGYSCGVSFGNISAVSSIRGTTLCGVIVPPSMTAGEISFKLRTPTGSAIGLTFEYTENIATWGACCVKFGVTGASYGICLGPHSSAGTCLTHVLSMVGSGTWPWTLSYTHEFLTNTSCAGCTGIRCPDCWLPDAGGTCGVPTCPVCCLRYGICVQDCECTEPASPYNCGFLLTWNANCCCCVSGGPGPV